MRSPATFHVEPIRLRPDNVPLGYDAFVSYSYKDGKGYAAALEDRLAKLDFCCFLDRKELPFGVELTASLRRAIRRSKAVILVGTETALQAQYVKVELVEALTNRRTKLIPIDVDGIRERIDAVDVRNLIWLNEDAAAARARVPSTAVLDAIGNHFGFTRRKTVARRVVGIVAVCFFVLAVVASWQWRVAVEQRNTAVSRELAARSKLLVESEPDTALLVAAESARVRDTFEARDALLGSIGSRPGLELVLHGAGKVTRVVFSADGRSLLSVASGDEAKVWDLYARPPAARPAAAGEVESWSKSDESSSDRVQRLLESITGTGVGIRTHAVSADGRLAAVSDGERVTLWNVASRKQVGGPRSAQQRYVRALAFGSTGLLASGSSAGTIAIWQVDPRVPIGRVFEGLEISANSVAFSGDGSKVAAGGYNGDVLVWDVRSGQQIGRRLAGRGGPVEDLRFCEDEARLVAAGSEVIRWNLASGQPEAGPRKLPEHAEVAISPDCEHLVMGANDGRVQFQHIGTGEIRRPTSNEHRDRTSALAFSADGKTVASGGNDRRIRLWDVATAAPTGKPLDAHTTTIAGLAFAGGGDELASLDSDGTMMIWDVKTQGPIGRPLRITEEYAAQSALALSPDATTAATSSRGGLIHLWDVATWRVLGRPLTGHPGDITTMRFSPDGRWLASASLGGTVIVWNLRTESWIDAARRIANRELSEREQAIYLGTGASR